MKFQAELTDTFGGEANYSWVRREEWQWNSKESDRSLIRKAKKELGITARHTKASYGEMIELRFPGFNKVCFITWEV